ncbi:MAG: glycerophosphodiester phosphodiesterase [Candidatus Sumerlaeia bacterium]|nr:glycerophosphodiester phosphodiesterase [Candidatus Sumerlaeia bacterium]
MKSAFRLLGALTFAAMTFSISPAESSAVRDFDPPMIIAHRGASAYAPENTVASAVLAWRMNSHAVEIDVYMTTDNKIVVMHDYNAERTTGVDIKMFEATWDDLRHLDAGSWKNIAFTGEPIPLLEDIIDTMPEGGKLFIEIKYHGAEIVPHLKKVMEESGRLDDLIVIGFTFETMRAMREAMPDVPIKWLVYPRQDDEGKIIPISPDDIRRAAEAKFTSMNVAHTGVTPELVELSHELGMDVYVWTVNDVEIARRMVDLGVVGITTDVPDVMLREFHGPKD